MSKGTKPLEGIRIVELTTYVAAPGAARILADQGADVIKFEQIIGDPTRFQGYLLTCPTKEDENPCFDLVNANKRFVAIDIKTQKGMEIIHKCLENSDVLITNYREDALKKINLSYEQVSARYPEIVYGHINSYGEKGADAGDNPTAFALAQGVTAALLKRERTGKGDKVSVSLFHTAIWTLSQSILSTQYKAKYPVSYNESPLSSLTGHPYKCADGKWVIIMLLDFAKYFKPFYKSINREDLIDNSKFNTPLAAKQNQSELVEILSKEIGSKPYEVWGKKWKTLDIHFEALKHISTPPIQFREMGQAEYKTTGGAGANTVEILKSLGYTSKEIEEMKNNKIVK